MSGLLTGRNMPATITITPTTPEVDPLHPFRGVRKTSRIGVNALLGSNLVLGLPIPEDLKVRLTFIDDDTQKREKCDDVTDDSGWKGVVEALRQFMQPAPDQEVVIFELPDAMMTLTSELAARPKPGPGDEYRLPVIVGHAEEGASTHDVLVSLRRGNYGKGESVIKPPGTPA